MINNDRTCGKRSSRRSVMKTIVGGAATGTALLSGSATARGHAKEIEPGEAEKPNPDVQVRKVDRSVQTLSVHYPLLTLSEETVLGYIDDSDMSDKETREAKRAALKLRQRFPVKREKDGNTTWLTLAVDRESTEEDGDLFTKAHRAFANGASGHADGGFSTMHQKELHRQMTEQACEEMWLDTEVTDTISAAADNPDNPQVTIDVPDWIPHQKDIENGLENAIEEYAHHVGQYYDPDPFWGDYECYHNTHDADFTGLGKAPTAADISWNNAEYYSNESQEEWVGYLVHYPQDMGVPLHTGMGWEQANLELYWDSGCGCITWGVDPLNWLHSAYEDFVNDQWTERNFLDSWNSDCGSGCYDYYPTDNGAEAAANTADYSTQYSYEVFHQIMEEGNEGDKEWWEWDSATKDKLANITQNCLDESGLWTRGCIHYFYG